MCISLATAVVLGSLASAGAAVYSGQQAAGEQKKANNLAVQNAQRQAAEQDQAFNQMNKKRPNTDALRAANLAAAQGGVGSTSLTGAAGVDPNTVALGKSTLLGG